MKKNTKRQSRFAFGCFRFFSAPFGHSISPREGALWKSTSMAAEKEEPHRPGAFKQQNKSHKTGRHRSKGQLEKSNKGTYVLR